jgi:endonuclease-3
MPPRPALPDASLPDRAALPRPPAPVGFAERKAQAGRVTRRLAAGHGNAVCALEYDSPVQLLVATILSAQCTDERVNIVTKKLFADCPTAADLAALPIAKLENYVKSTGFFRNKAKNVKACCAELVENHGGKVPQDMETLVALPGVGRKTANVVLGTAFGIASGVVVDTHVGRISRRTGLTEHDDPVKVERDLMELLPKSRWVDFAHQMIYHGRRVCDARRPQCEVCSMRKFCPRGGVG